MSYHKRLKDKIVNLEKALVRLKTYRERGKKIVFTNGCFDILHPGHVDYLSQARDLGDVLVLGLNTDASVQRLHKAPNRPVNDEFARATVLAALACIDMVIFFNEDTPYELIDSIRPDVLVKGNDYTIEQVVGHDIVQSYGGSVITIPLLEGYSTSAIIQKILK
jgi:D-glycero-beta-D-manno-heptose 1-phosphate adenylyltransferase